jgi:hypothetical protein
MLTAGNKGLKMQRFLLVTLGLMLIVAAVSALVKGILILAAIVLGLILLVRLYQARATAFYAVCTAGAAALLPKTTWPWVGVAVLVWLVLEMVHAAYTRLRRPARLRLPPA